MAYDEKLAARIRDQLRSLEFYLSKQRCHRQLAAGRDTPRRIQRSRKITRGDDVRANRRRNQRCRRDVVFCDSRRVVCTREATRAIGRVSRPRVARRKSICWKR